MPFAVDPAVANSPIIIPVDLPDIMKQYTKAAIRTQPRDVLQWSAAYFNALANGDYPPVKERIEFITSDKSAWISLGFLRVLHRQLGDKDKVSVSQIQENWEGLCLDKQKLADVIQKGQFTDAIDWMSFLAVVCCLSKENLLRALTMFCEVVTEESEGCPACVSYSDVSHAYLTMVDYYGNVDQNSADAFLLYLSDCAEIQNDRVHPGNFASIAFPHTM